MINESMNQWWTYEQIVKNLIMRDVAQKFKGIDGVAVINPRGINANKNNQNPQEASRQEPEDDGGEKQPRPKGAQMKATASSKGFEQLLDGPSALIYGQASIATIARMLLDEKKIDEKIELRGVFLTVRFTPARRASSRSAKCRPAKRRSGICWR